MKVADTDSIKKKKRLLIGYSLVNKAHLAVFSTRPSRRTLWVAFLLYISQYSLGNTYLFFSDGFWKREVRELRQNKGFRAISPSVPKSGISCRSELKGASNCLQTSAVFVSSRADFITSCFHGLSLDHCIQHR